MELTVACVLWQGDFRGRSYTPMWVERLKSMVERNLQERHRFVCLSNIDVPCERIPLKRGWPGWWAKMELFDPHNGLEGRILYLDLDVVITGRLEPFFDYESPFALVKAWQITSPKIKAQKWIVPRYNSSVMVWSTPYQERLFTSFSEKNIRFFRGDQDFIGAHISNGKGQDFRSDQDWIGTVMLDANTLPQGWVTKLRYCPDGPPPGCKVVLVMPGKNEAASLRHEWVRKLWV